VTDARVLRDVVGRIVRALVALHEGEIPLATRILEDLERELREPDFERPHRCPTCGNSYRFPGELEDHLYVSGCSRRLRRTATA